MAFLPGINKLIIAWLLRNTSFPYGITRHPYGITRHPYGMTVLSISLQSPMRPRSFCQARAVEAVWPRWSSVKVRVWGVRRQLRWQGHGVAAGEVFDAGEGGGGDGPNDDCAVVAEGFGAVGCAFDPEAEHDFADGAGGDGEGDFFGDGGVVGAGGVAGAQGVQRP